MYENVGVWALSDSVYAAAEQVEGPSVTKLSSLDRPCIALHMRPSKMWLTECEVKEQARGRFQ